jgi:hypothetical protein
VRPVVQALDRFENAAPVSSRTAMPGLSLRTKRRTYGGRALAVLRPTGAGKIRLTATAPDCAPVEVTVTVA